MYKNRSLKKYEGIYNIEHIEKLEATGIILYMKYGQDLYNYAEDNAPVDIKAVHNYLVKYGISYNDYTAEELAQQLIIKLNE